MKELYLNTLTFVNGMLGCQIKFKELHWITEDAQAHEVSETTFYELMYGTDKIMEQILSIVGRDSMTLGDIFPEVPVADDVVELIDVANKVLSGYRQYMNANYPDNFGVIADLDSIISNININKYRGELK